MPKVSFNNKHPHFYGALKSSVDEYFENNHLKKTGNRYLFTKTLLLIPAAFSFTFPY
jgi:linoleoyl-CoA desaturase